MTAEPSALPPTNLHELLNQAELARIPWSVSSTQLNVNLVVLDETESIPAHRNAEVDVFVICLSGSGDLIIDGDAHALEPGSAVLIPSGREREVHARSTRLAYLTCHRRRAELWPSAGGLRANARTRGN